MALHEQAVGATDEWYTPAHVFTAMDVRFDSDPCPAPVTCPANEWCDLQGCWSGLVWLNPPFGRRNGIAPWLDRFFLHGQGVALTPDRTSAPWWQHYARDAHAVLFVAPKLKFLDANLNPGASPAQGTSLLALGDRAVAALASAQRNGLGVVLRP